MNASLPTPSKVLTSSLLIGSLLTAPISQAASTPSSSKTVKKSASRETTSEAPRTWQATIDAHDNLLIKMRHIESNYSIKPKSWGTSLDFLQGLITHSSDAPTQEVFDVFRPLMPDLDTKGRLSVHADSKGLQSAGEMSVKLYELPPLVGNLSLWGHAVAGEGSLGAKAQLLVLDPKLSQSETFLRKAHLNGHAKGTYQKVHYQLHADSEGEWVTEQLAACDLNLELQRSENDYALRVRAHAPGTSRLAARIHEFNQQSDKFRKDCDETLKTAHLTLKSLTVASAEAPPPESTKASPAPSSESANGGAATSTSSLPTVTPKAAPTASPATSEAKASAKEDPKAGCTGPDADLDVSLVVTSKDQHLADTLVREFKLEGPSSLQYHKAINEITYLGIDKVAVHARVDGTHVSTDVDVDLSEFNHFILGLVDLCIGVCDSPPALLTMFSPPKSAQAKALMRQQGARLRALRPVLAEIYQTHGQSSLDGDLAVTQQPSGNLTIDMQVGTAFDMREALPVLKHHHVHTGDFKTFWTTLNLQRRLFTAAGNVDYAGPVLGYWKQLVHLFASTMGPDDDPYSAKMTKIFKKSVHELDWKRLDFETVWNPERFTIHFQSEVKDLNPISHVFRVNQEFLPPHSFIRFAGTSENGQSTSVTEEGFRGVRADQRTSVVRTIAEASKAEAAHILKTARFVEQIGPFPKEWKASPVMKEFKP